MEAKRSSSSSRKYKISKAMTRWLNVYDRDEKRILISGFLRAIQHRVVDMEIIECCVDYHDQCVYWEWDKCTLSYLQSFEQAVERAERAYKIEKFADRVLGSIRNYERKRERKIKKREKTSKIEKQTSSRDEGEDEDFESKIWDRVLRTLFYFHPDCGASQVPFVLVTLSNNYPKKLTFVPQSILAEKRSSNVSFASFKCAFFSNQVFQAEWDAFRGLLKKDQVGCSESDLTRRHMLSWSQNVSMQPIAQRIIPLTEHNRSSSNHVAQSEIVWCKKFKHGATSTEFAIGAFMVDEREDFGDGESPQFRLRFVTSVKEPPDAWDESAVHTVLWCKETRLEEVETAVFSPMQRHRLCHSRLLTWSDLSAFDALRFGCHWEILPESETALNVVCEYTWNISHARLEQFKHCEHGQHFYSPPFNNGAFAIMASPKGWKASNEGTLIWQIKLLRLPSQVSAVGIRLKMQTCFFTNENEFGQIDTWAPTSDIELSYSSPVGNKSGWSSQYNIGQAQILMRKLIWCKAKIEILYIYGQEKHQPIEKLEWSKYGIL